MIQPLARIGNIGTISVSPKYLAGCAKLWGSFVKSGVLYL